MVYSGMERTSGDAKFAEEYRNAVANDADAWIAACGGLETPFSHCGVDWLYVYNPARDEHGYLNMSTDIVQEKSPWDK